MQGFDKLTVVIMASNEQASLRETIRVLAERCNPSDIREIVVFLKSSDCPAAAETQRIQAENASPFPVRSAVQKEATVQRAFSEIPPLVHSSHFLIMFADNETDPSTVPVLIEKAKQHPDAIVCAAKWRKDSVVHGYGFLRTVGSRSVNKIVAHILRADADDLFSVFQIVPMDVVVKLDMHDPETFLYEYTIKPLACGVPYIEVPTVYEKRTENKSNYHFLDMLQTAFRFFSTAVLIRSAR